MSRVYSVLKSLPLVLFVGLSGCQFSKVDPDEQNRRQQQELQRQQQREAAEKTFSEKMTVAIQSNDLAAFRSLIDSVSVEQLETVNEAGELWLHEVVRKDRYHLAQALIEKGVSVFRVEERSGLSALALAKQSSHAEMYRLIDATARLQFQEIVHLLEQGELQSAVILQGRRGLLLQYRSEDSRGLASFVLQNIARYKKTDIAVFEDLVLSASDLTALDLNQVFEGRFEYSESFFRGLLNHQSFVKMDLSEKEQFLVKAYETVRFGPSTKGLALQKLVGLSFSGRQRAFQLLQFELTARTLSQAQLFQGLEIIASGGHPGLIENFQDLKSFVQQIKQAFPEGLSNNERLTDLLLKIMVAEIKMDFSSVKELKSQGSLGRSVMEKILSSDRAMVNSDFFQSALAHERGLVFEMLRQLSGRQQKNLAPEATLLLRLAKDQSDYDLIFERVLVASSTVTQTQWLQQLMVLLEKRWTHVSGIAELFTKHASYLLNEERWKSLDEKDFHGILDKEAHFVVTGELDVKPAQVFRAIVHARGRKMTDGLVLRFGNQDYQISNYSFFIAVHLARSPSAGSEASTVGTDLMLQGLIVEVVPQGHQQIRLVWNDLKLLSAYLALEKKRTLSRLSDVLQELEKIDTKGCTLSRVKSRHSIILPCYSRLARPVFETFESVFSKEFLSFLRANGDGENQKKVSDALKRISSSHPKFQALVVSSLIQLKDIKNFNLMSDLWEQLDMAMPSRDRVPYHLIGLEVFYPRLQLANASEHVSRSLDTLVRAMVKTSPRLVYGISTENYTLNDWVYSRKPKDDFLCNTGFKQHIFLESLSSIGIRLELSDLNPLRCDSVEYNTVVEREKRKKERIDGREVEVPVVQTSDTPEDARNLVRVMSGSEYQWIEFLRDLDKRRDQLHPLAVKWLDSLPQFLFER